jgi:hypothetical protein
MRSTFRNIALVVTFAAAAAFVVGISASARTPLAPAAPGVQAASMTSIGALAFGPADVLFASDTQSASIHALQLGAQANGGAPGTADIEAVDQKIAATLGTDAAGITITDLAVHPRTRNTFIAVMRGQGPDARPALIRIDGAGAVTVVDVASLKQTSVALPNPPAAGATRNARAQTVTDMAFQDGKLWVAGLSNEEFSSKLRAIPYPFAAADTGASVEIFHGNHGRLETNSPVYAFVPYTVGGAPHLIAGYLCTPLVKFPVSDLKSGAKVRGTTIAELGNRNRPIDMVVYTKGGAEFLLMSNTSRGVMKIPTAGFASATPIVAPVPEGTAGVAFETIASLAGVTQLDRFDGSRMIVLARGDASAPFSLKVVPLP